MRTYRIEPTAIRAMQNPSGGTGLKADGGNVANVLHEIRRKSPDQDWPQICELLEAVVSGTVDVQPKKCGDKLILGFTQRQKGVAPIKFEASSMSDGSLRALGLITAVFQYPKPSLLLIESPEASIHPTALGTIIDVLRLASHSMQVVVITHSPDLLDAEWDRGSTLANPKLGTWSLVAQLCVAGCAHSAQPEPYGSRRVAPFERPNSWSTSQTDRTPTQLACGQSANLTSQPNLGVTSAESWPKPCCVGSLQRLLPAQFARLVLHTRDGRLLAKS